MTRRFSILVGALIGLAGACDGNPTEPPDGFPHAMATPSCGPVDQALVAIYLAAAPIESLQPAPPFVQVTVPAARAGRTWAVSESYAEGTAWRYDGGTSPPIMARRGEVGITDSSATLIRGYVDLRFTDGVRIRGRFDALWQPRQQLCG